MPTSKLSTKKNILDAYHQKNLNYFNISAISLITSIFTVIWGYLTEQITLDFLVLGILIVSLIFGTFLLIAYRRLNKIMKAIKEL